MKRYFKIIVLFLITMTACNEGSNSNPLIIGHRGARGHVAENTLPSISKALSLGVDGIEVDIFRCASGELVVFHDATLEKLTNATGPIEALDLDSIQKIKVLKDYAIPTLEEVLTLIDGKVLLNIELKGTQTALLTNELLKKKFSEGSWSSDKILVSSFNWDELALFYEVTKEIPIAVLTEDDPLDAIPIAKQLEAVAINPNFKSLNENNVRRIHKEGLKIYPWTVNKQEDIDRMIKLGVDAIITDFPDRVYYP